MSGEQKLKDGDEVVYTKETTNSAELLFFTNHARCTNPAIGICRYQGQRAG